MLAPLRRPAFRLVLLSVFAAALAWTTVPSVSAAEPQPPRRLEIIGLLKVRNFETLEARLGNSGQVRDGYSSLFSYSDPAIEADLNAWVEARPDSALPYAARASYYDHIAGLRRGDNYRNRTHAGQFAGMRHYFELAARDYREVLARDDGVGETYAALIHIALNLGDEAAANRLRREGLTKARNAFPIHWAIIVKLQPKWGGSWQEVQAYISGLQRRRPDDPNYKFLSGHFDEIMANRLHREENYEAALEHIDHALATGDTSGRQYKKAKILIALERKEESLEAIDKAIAHDPDSHFNYTLRAGINLQIGDFDAAYRDVAFTLALDPYNPDLLIRRAEYLSRELSRLPEDASAEDIAALKEARGAYLRKALVHGEYNAAVHMEMGKYYALRPKTKDRAIGYHLRSVELMPRVPGYWLAFAETLLLSNDCRAVETARRYLSVCNAANDCTPKKWMVQVIETNLASCGAPQMSGEVELPLAPKRAAELNQLVRCNEFFDARDDGAAIRACLELAKANDTDAQFDMGMLYVFSGGQLSIRGAESTHLALAFEWLDKAAGKNHTRAMGVLGNMYLHGIGITRDSIQALALLGKAAKQGNADAAVGLGMAYHRGIGVPKDASKAETYYRKAIALGHKGAANFLARLHDNQG